MNYPSKAYKIKLSESKQGSPFVMVWRFGVQSAIPR